jgi:hypothetical protein
VKVFAVFLLIAQATVVAGAGRNMHTSLRTVGSIPLTLASFGCVAELNGKPYSDKLVNDCLRSIKEVSFVKNATVQKSLLSDGRIFVKFEAKARSLRITSMTFNVDEAEERELKEWLKSTLGTLRAGADFSGDDEAVTYEQVRRFYFGRGLVVGIVPRLDLSYSSGTARVNFEIVKGPKFPRESLTLPYDVPCTDRIEGANWSQTDDHVPIELVMSLVRLNASLACYSDQAVQHDQQVLRNLPFLESAKVEQDGEKGNRHLSYAIKGRQLNVRQVSLRTYGTPSSCSDHATENLPLKTGSVFSASAARQSVDDLTKTCSRDRFWVEVREEDQFVDPNQLDVTFHVLTFPIQTILVDGTKMD